ncbi:helix-turn-helix domain-containing protein [Domibacillus robiginosus]|uniref:helix-turn-helix domain-containing protein n=1 Tax=Domibacillus robiginosus TaxID=1071054 RepID=UPI00067D2309|nr:helix-turn-helix domain-containing protein [Domibacillus robiginosus]
MIASILKVVLHPVRMKIIQSFIGGKKRTVQELAQRIQDVPTPSLYRHINMLLEAGLVEVVEEHPIRGTVEKVYALKEQAPDTFLKMTKEEHIDLFTAFAAQLIASFEQYVSGEGADLQRDGVGYRIDELHVTDEEFHELVQKIGGLIVEAMQNEPAPERKVKRLATIIIPEAKHHD